MLTWTVRDKDGVYAGMWRASSPQEALDKARRAGQVSPRREPYTATPS